MQWNFHRSTFAFTPMTMSRSVVNDGGLGEGAVFPDGLVLRERVPQGHKVALADLAEGDEVIRYNVVIGYALKALPEEAGSTST